MATPSAPRTEATALLSERPPPQPAAVTWRVLCTRAIVTNLLLLSLLQALDKSDMRSTVAGMLRAMEQEFGINADQEALLLLVSALPTAFFAPLWGMAADAYPRFQLMITAAIIWGSTTFVSAFAPAFWVLCVSRAVTAAALGAILPISQGIVADLVPAVYRGRMFALLTVFGGVGAGGALLLATYISGDMIGGLRGWRWIVVGIAALSLLAACAIYLCAVEPRRLYPTVPLSCQTANDTMRYMSNVPTFILLVIQGLFGLVPWSAFSGFGPLWLQYSGLDKSQTSLALVCFGVGNGLGELLGGVLGDLATQWSPDTGRARVAQISNTCGITIALLMFVIVPSAKESFGAVLVLLLLFGLTASWCGSGVKTPMLAEIVPHRMMVSVMGMDYGLEHASSAIFGSLVSGVLAQHVFGYEASPADFADMPVTLRENNAKALSHSMVWMMIVPWVVCVGLWSLICFTYPQDRDRAMQTEAEEKTRTQTVAGAVGKADAAAIKDRA